MVTVIHLSPKEVINKRKKTKTQKRVFQRKKISMKRKLRHRQCESVETEKGQHRQNEPSK